MAPPRVACGVDTRKTDRERDRVLRSTRSQAKFSFRHRGHRAGVYDAHRCKFNFHTTPRACSWRVALFVIHFTGGGNKEEGPWTSHGAGPVNEFDSS